jgi:AcrR family transcriptional regulator
LILAGVHEFASQGYESASTRTIATKAGVCQAAVDFHFGSKDDLWRAAAEKAFGEFHATFGTALETSADLEPRERAEILVTEAVVFFAKHPEFHRFLTNTVPGPRLQWLIETHINPLHAVFDALIADLDADLDNEVPDRSHLFYMFIGAASTPYEMAEEFQAVNGTSPFDAEAVTRHAESMILTFLPPAKR